MGMVVSSMRLRAAMAPVMQGSYESSSNEGRVRPHRLRYPLNILGCTGTIALGQCAIQIHNVFFCSASPASVKP